MLLSTHPPQGNYSDLLVALSSVYSDLRGDAPAQQADNLQVWLTAGGRVGWFSVCVLTGPQAPVSPRTSWLAGAVLVQSVRV